MCLVSGHRGHSELVGHDGRHVLEALLGSDGRFDLDALDAAFSRARAQNSRVAYLMSNRTTRSVLCTPPRSVVILQAVGEIAAGSRAAQHMLISGARAGRI
jgi:hypothetical protein